MGVSSAPCACRKAYRSWSTDMPERQRTYGQRGHVVGLTPVPFHPLVDRSRGASSRCAAPCGPTPTPLRPGLTADAVALRSSIAALFHRFASSAISDTRTSRVTVSPGTAPLRIFVQNCCTAHVSCSAVIGIRLSSTAHALATAARMLVPYPSRRWWSSTCRPST